LLPRRDRWAEERVGASFVDDEAVVGVGHSRHWVYGGLDEGSDVVGRDSGSSGGLVMHSRHA